MTGNATGTFDYGTNLSKTSLYLTYVNGWVQTDSHIHHNVRSQHLWQSSQ